MKYTEQNLLKVGTDFSGIGAPEQALRNLGIPHRSVFACEKDKFARQTYLANFTPEQMFEDITTRDNDTSDIPCELYIAGFPCQAFSLSGKRLGFEDVRGTLFFNSADYIRKKQPKFFILENVKGLLSHDKPKGSKAKHGRTFNTIINLLSATVNGQEHFPFYEDHLNYNVHYRVLNTKEYGVPQNRERIFIIGIRADLPNEFQWPKKFKLEKFVYDILEPEVDEKYFLSDSFLEYLFTNQEAQKEAGNGFRLNLIDGKENTEAVSTTIKENYHKGTGDATYIVHSLYPRSSKSGNGGTGPLEKNDVPSFCVDANNNQAIELPFVDELIQVGTIPGKYETQSRVYTALGLAPCLRAKKNEANMLIHGRVRKFTPLECFRLQSFPDSYVKPVSNTQLYRQCGNSISVNVIERVIKNLLQWETN